MKRIFKLILAVIFLTTGYYIVNNFKHNVTRQKLELAPTQSNKSPNAKEIAVALQSPADDPTQALMEIQQLQNEVEDIYLKTNFDHTQMTTKEYEDSIALLKIYNDKMKVLLAETKKAVH